MLYLNRSRDDDAVECVDRANNNLEKNVQENYLMKLFQSAAVISFLVLAQNVLAGGGTQPGKVPEPGFWALMGIGAVAFVARQLMKKR